MPIGLLGQDVGGYAQGPIPTGEAGVPQTGINWSDILGAALQYGSKKGSSGPAIGNFLQSQYGGAGMPGQPTPQQTGGLAPLMDTQKQQTSFESIMPLILKIIGYGV